VRRVLEHRFLRSTHILSLTSGSRQQVLRRLQRLFHHGFLNRPRAQLDYYRAGSQPIVYALGNEGMKLLAGEDGLSPGKLDWTTRSRNVTRFFMEHALAVADALVKIETCSRLHDFSFLRGELDTPLKWKVMIRHRGASANVGVVPDAVFAVISKAGTRWFFLEADRGTMPVERSRLKQTSFMRKVLAYQETWAQGLLKDSVPRFQVLTVTTTPAHAQNLVQATQRITKGKGAGLFLFTDQRTFASQKDVFVAPFLNGRGEQVTLWP
jgi:hypothetical protein